MHYKKPKNRNELTLFNQIDLYVGQDNVVRLLDRVADEFVKANEFSWSGKEIKGCTSYPPACMLKLLLYCYYNWIPGSRRMEKETYRNIEVIWLLGGLKPDHWTICSFRRGNKGLIRSAAIEFRKFLYENGYIGGNTIAIDGSKMKANAARDMFSEEKLAKRIENIEKELDKFHGNAEENDRLEGMLEEESGENKKLREKLAKLEKEKSRLEGISKLMEETGKKYISPADPDASLMKGRDGMMACYNVQTGVDAKHHMIAFAEGTTDPCDIHLLKEGVDNLEDQLGVVPSEVEADKGYANVIQIREMMESGGIKFYVPFPQQHSKKEDGENNIRFDYNKEDDTYTCPDNKKLYLEQKGIKKNNQIYNRYLCHECEGCPLKEKCTQSKTGRRIYVNINQEWIDNYKEWINKEENKEKVKERKTIVEHPYGTIKFMMGKLGFLLRGKEKVQTEIDLYSTVYNLKRLFNIENMENLLKQVENYNWKVAA